MRILNSISTLVYSYASLGVVSVDELQGQWVAALLLLLETGAQGAQEMQQGACQWDGAHGAGSLIHLPVTYAATETGQPVFSKVTPLPNIKPSHKRIA